MPFLKPDGSSFTVCTEEVLGLGRSGIVLCCGQHALKIAKARDTSNMTQDKREVQEHMNHVAREILQNEKGAYKRVGKHSGIAEYVELLQDGILLILYGRDSVDHYIALNKELDWWTKRRWILSLIETLAYLHESRILVNDLALRNLMIADDFSLRMIDFSDCAVLPLDTDPSTANVDGITAKTDIFHLGCLIYSVAAWQRYESDFFDLDSRFPPLNDLPAVDHLPCAEILRKCWTGGYSSVVELRTEADTSFIIGLGDISSFWARRCSNFLNSIQSSLPGSL